MSKSDAQKLLIDFLNKENRPFAINDIWEGCGKDLGKSTVQRTLDTLADKDKISVKTFGKHKIYFSKQSKDLLEMKRELQLCTKKLAQSENNVNNKKAQYHELQIKLKSLSNVRSTESLEEERSQLLDEIREMNEKLRRHEAKSAETKLTPADAKKIEKTYANVSSEYRKRKRICVDMLDAILEGYPKSKKALIEDIGLETDEEVGFNMPAKR